jgi:biopolymer transport protein ExbD
MVQAEAPTIALAGTVPSNLGLGRAWLLTVYVLGMLGLLALWGLQRWRLYRQLRDARLVRHDLGGVPVFEHATLGPLVAGIVRPRIVMPAALLAASPADDLALMLAHEAAHVRRRDHLLLPLVQLLTIVAWPVLPLWLAARQVRGLVELACDEQVLAGRSGEQRRRYGELLVSLSTGDLLVSAHAPSFGWELRTRVRALKRVRRWQTSVQTALVAGIGAVLLACSGPPAEPAEDATASAERPPVLTITRTGALYLGRKAIEPGALETELRAAVATGVDTILVRGSQSSLSGGVDIMAAAKAAGVRNLNILADPEGPRGCPPDQLCGRKGPLIPPEEPPPPASARGSLDREIIAGVLRAQIGAVKACYEAGLARSPKLGGRIMTTFTIGAAGTVTASKIGSSTLRDHQVEACIVDVVNKLKFPKPEGGGVVVVSYPFTFAPAN